MKKYFVLAVGMGLVVSASAQAQNGGLSQPVCVAASNSTPDRVAQDACQQAYDVYQFMGPQLGLAVAGGNHTLGSNSSLGGLGHFSLGLHATGFRGSLPQVDQFTQRSSGASPARELPTKDQFLGLPGADAAIGIFGGLPLALTNVGGIDLLLSASYIPDVSENQFTVRPKQNLQVGYGARIGLLSESILVPGVSLTYLKRDLPTTTIVGTATYNDLLTGPTTATLTVSDFKVKTSGWRLVASKSLVIFGLAAGVGQDTYDQSAGITATVSGTQPTIPPSSFTTTATVPGTSQSMTRTNYFVDATLHLFLLKITGEIGQVSGGTVNTYNTFQSGRADKAQTYGSVGFRLGF
jgi:hypothetical protein